ncbi:hypothetical protein RJT34_12984 [Clitoria ternatea]|uniref:Uncharacterized protein n=1 Tax=Clitoria ternatea TaxID=43366 RepID=A0AAN9PLF0_CLITE
MREGGNAGGGWRPGLTVAEVVGQRLGEQGPVRGTDLSCSERWSSHGGASSLMGHVAVHEEEDLVDGLRKKTGVGGGGPTTGRTTTMTLISSPFSIFDGVGKSERMNVDEVG